MVIGRKRFENSANVFLTESNLLGQCLLGLGLFTFTIFNKLGAFEVTLPTKFAFAKVSPQIILGR